MTHVLEMPLSWLEVLEGLTSLHSYTGKIFALENSSLYGCIRIYPSLLAGTEVN